QRRLPNSPFVTIAGAGLIGLAALFSAPPAMGVVCQHAGADMFGNDAYDGGLWNNTACGRSSVANANDPSTIRHRATAYGFEATATGVDSTAIGARSDASSENSTAIGALSDASGRLSTAVGAGA